MPTSSEKSLQVATFAAGCFWGIEAAFQKIPGVVSTRVGYTGGHFENPCYLDVCARITGHAEAVQLEYDPQQVSYEQLLEKFWQIHDPTSLNRQGPDRGDQYRSAIFYHNQAQEEAARHMKGKLNNSGRYEKPVVTEISAASTFYPAEEEHQNYYAKKKYRKLR